MDPGLVRLVRRGMQYSAVDYVQARIERLAYCDRLARFFEKYDFLLTPATAVPAFAVGQVSPDPPTATTWRTCLRGRRSPSRSTRPATRPRASRAGFTEDGLPIGLQIVGRLHEDQEVLQAAAAFERIRPLGPTGAPVVPA